MISNTALQKTERSYGVDLLRIVSMLMVLVQHILGLNQFLTLKFIGTSAIHENFAWLLEAFALVAVNCYALISGYVGYGRKIRYSNIMHLYFSVIFYTLSLPVIMMLLFDVSVLKTDFIYAFIPMIRSNYWYFIAYFVLFFFTPFLNILADKLDKAQFRKLIVTIVILFSLVPTFLFTDTAKINYGYTPLWLGAMYLVGSYIKKYSVKYSKKLCIFTYIACSLVTWLYQRIAALITIKIFGVPKLTNIFYNYTAPTIFLGAVMLFIFFIQLKIPKGFGKLIAITAPLSFSVYIIHENPYISNHFIVNTMCDLVNLNPVLFGLSIIGIALAIYTICSLIDLIRFYLFKVLRIKELCMKAEDLLSAKLKRFFE